MLLMMTLSSCSATRVLSEDQEWLAKNKIVVQGDKRYNGRELQPYLKQKENNSFLFGWKPFLYVYNWQDGKGKGWDKFVKKLGDAPVIFEENLVSGTERSMLTHLNYTGYYHSKVRSEIVRKKPKEVTVTYYVQPGQRRRIDSLVYLLPSDSTLRAIFCADTVNSTIRKGSWLSGSARKPECRGGARQRLSAQQRLLRVVEGQFFLRGGHHQQARENHPQRQDVRCGRKA